MGDLSHEPFRRYRVGLECIESMPFFLQHHNLNALSALLQPLTVVQVSISEHISAPDRHQQRRQRHLFSLGATGFQGLLNG